MSISSSFLITPVYAIIGAPASQVRVKVASGTFYGVGTETASGKKPCWDIIAGAKKYPFGTKVTVLKIRIGISQKDAPQRRFEVKTLADIGKLASNDPKEQRHVLLLKKYLAKMIGHTFSVGDRGRDVEKGYSSKGVNYDVLDFFIRSENESAKEGEAKADLLGRIELSVKIVLPKK